MAKYQDKTKSRLAAHVSKYKKGENAGDRHTRRLLENRGHADILRNYCQANGWQFAITNEDQHWQMRRGKLIFDWFPSSAKLVVNQQWQKGIHVHDITQIKSYLEFAKLLGM